jgi:hypothetical protein
MTSIYKQNMTIRWVQESHTSEIFGMWIFVIGLFELNCLHQEYTICFCFPITTPFSLGRRDIMKYGFGVYNIGAVAIPHFYNYFNCFGENFGYGLGEIVLCRCIWDSCITQVRDTILNFLLSLLHHHSFIINRSYVSNLAILAKSIPHQHKI